jgi:hypothetical protein
MSRCSADAIIDEKIIFYSHQFIGPHSILATIISLLNGPAVLYSQFIV